MKLLHVHERAIFQGGVEQILHDTARGLSARGWQQALLHVEPPSDPGFLAPFHDAASDSGLLARFHPDVVLLHKVSDTSLVQSITRRYPAVRMVHDHDLVCLRRHKYFPLSGRIRTHLQQAGRLAMLLQPVLRQPQYGTGRSAGQYPHRRSTKAGPARAK